MVSVTWLYRSIVVLMVECPRRSCATFGCGSKPPDQNTSLKLGETAASRPCVNSSARRLCRNIFYKLHIMRTNDAADIRFHASSENCIFYISPISDFSHSLLAAVFPKFNWFLITQWSLPLSSSCAKQADLTRQGHQRRVVIHPDGCIGHRCLVIVM